MLNIGRGIDDLLKRPKHKRKCLFQWKPYNTRTLTLETDLANSAS